MIDAYQLVALLHTIIALAGYGAIAAYIAPRFTAYGAPGWVRLMQCSAVAFFFGCAAHHLLMAHHLIADPAEWMIAKDHILVEVLQAVAAPTFLLSAARLGTIQIQGRASGPRSLASGPRIVFPRALPFLIFGLIAALLVWRGYMITNDVSPITYPSGGYVVQSPVKIGGPLSVTIERCNTTDKEINAVSTRELENVETGEYWLLAPMGVSMAPHNCQTTINIPMYVLPEDLPPGRYILHGTISISGRYRGFLPATQSNPFDVIS